MIKIIIALNIGVYFLWQFSDNLGLGNFMPNNFYTSPALLNDGYYWTLLTSVFSHNMFFHLLINMFVLNSFGPVLLQILGKVRFLSFYIIAGVMGSIGHCYTAYYLIGQPNSMALGASGAIAGLISLFSIMFPKQILLLMGFIPVPAFFGIIAIIGLDLWGLSSQMEGGGLPIGHGAHLGGAFTGIIFYFLYVRPKIKKARQYSKVV